MGPLRNRIDPEVRAGLDRLLAVVGPDGLSGIRDIPERRRKQAEVKAMRPSRRLPSQVEIGDHVVPGARDRQPGVLLRTYVPSAVRQPAPCVFYVHGGGFVLGSVDGDEARAAELAVETGCIVTSVDYRLAPEYPFPAALDDCYQALCWVFENHRELGNRRRPRCPLRFERRRCALRGVGTGGEGRCRARDRVRHVGEPDA
jgi:acetyl esterase/lipase